MSSHDKQLDRKGLNSPQQTEPDCPCPQRRRLLAMLGMGIAATYVAPTLFSVGQAEARNRHGKHGSYVQERYSRSSYSWPSGYDGRRRMRSRLREYQEDPVLILEDVILNLPGY